MSNLKLADILKSKMCILDKDTSYDNGTNIMISETKDKLDNKYTFPHITIPHSGLYKITLEATLNINDEKRSP